MVQDKQQVCEAIPDELKQLPQWVCWKYERRGDKDTKVPYDALRGGPASSTDADSWCSFAEALAACENCSDYAGIGFVFSEFDPYCGVDLDDCRDPESGQFKDWAQEIVEQLASYSEVSPSGTGVKVFLKATKPGSRCRKAYHDGEVEIYDRDRFFTVTGQHLSETSTRIESRKEQLNALYLAVFGDDGHSDGPPVSSGTPGPNPSNNGHVHLDDNEIIELASNQRRSGTKFAALWSGNWNSHFNSASEADASVVFTLAFYTKDAAQIDRLFRSSGLMRPKWDEVHGDETYGERTITKALDKVTKQYKPIRKRKGNRKPKKPRGVEALATTSCGPSAANEPMPGTIDPGTGRLILSTARTLPTAEAFVREFFQHPLGRTLHHYAGLNMVWRENRYVESEDNAMRHQLLPWLHAAVRMSYDAEAEAFVPEDFPANPHTVKAALDSIKAHTHLHATTVSPSWLTSEKGQPNACEIVPCRSSLLHLPTMTTLPPTPAFFCVNALDYDPDPRAPLPDNWYRFLHELFDGDIQSWDLLQDWFG